MLEAKTRLHGTQVRIAGSPTEILEELTALLKGIRTNFIELADEELANMLIAQCGRIAFTDDDDEIPRILEETVDLLEEYERKQEEAASRG